MPVLRAPSPPPRQRVQAAPLRSAPIVSADSHVTTASSATHSTGTAAASHAKPHARATSPVRATNAAVANGAANGETIVVERLNLREDRPPPAPTVVANLTAPLLLPLAGRMAAGEIDVPERMVVSGLLRSERDGVAGAYAASGLAVEDELASGDWAALSMRR